MWRALFVASVVASIATALPASNEVTNIDAFAFRSKSANSTALITNLVGSGDDGFFVSGIFNDGEFSLPASDGTSPSFKGLIGETSGFMGFFDNNMSMNVKPVALMSGEGSVRVTHTIADDAVAEGGKQKDAPGAVVAGFFTGEEMTFVSSSAETGGITVKGLKGRQNLFVARYAIKANFIWARSFVVTAASSTIDVGVDLSARVAFDADGAVVVASSFVKSVEWMAGKTFEAAGDDHVDTFLVKLSGKDGSSITALHGLIPPHGGGAKVAKPEHTFNIVTDIVRQSCAGSNDEKASEFTISLHCHDVPAEDETATSYAYITKLTSTHGAAASIVLKTEYADFPLGPLQRPASPLANMMVPVRLLAPVPTMNESCGSVYFWGAMHAEASEFLGIGAAAAAAGSGEPFVFLGSLPQTLEKPAWVTKLPLSDGAGIEVALSTFKKGDKSSVALFVVGAFSVNSTNEHLKDLAGEEAGGLSHYITVINRENGKNLDSHLIDIKPPGKDVTIVPRLLVASSPTSFDLAVAGATVTAAANNTGTDVMAFVSRLGEFKLPGGVVHIRVQSDKPVPKKSTLSTGKPAAATAGKDEDDVILENEDGSDGGAAAAGAADDEEDLLGTAGPAASESTSKSEGGKASGKVDAANGKDLKKDGGKIVSAPPPASTKGDNATSKGVGKVADDTAADASGSKDAKKVVPPKEPVSTTKTKSDGAKHDAKRPGSTAPNAKVAPKKKVGGLADAADAKKGDKVPVAAAHDDTIGVNNDEVDKKAAEDAAAVDEDIDGVPVDEEAAGYSGKKKIVPPTLSEGDGAKAKGKGKPVVPSAGDGNGLRKTTPGAHESDGDEEEFIDEEEPNAPGASDASAPSGKKAGESSSNAGKKTGDAKSSAAGDKLGAGKAEEKEVVKGDKNELSGSKGDKKPGPGSTADDDVDSFDPDDDSNYGKHPADSGKSDSYGYTPPKTYEDSYLSENDAVGVTDDSMYEEEGNGISWFTIALVIVICAAIYILWTQQRGDKSVDGETSSTSAIIGSIMAMFTSGKSGSSSSARTQYQPMQSVDEMEEYLEPARNPVSSGAADAGLPISQKILPPVRKNSVPPVSEPLIPSTVLGVGAQNTSTSLMMHDVNSAEAVDWGWSEEEKGDNEGDKKKDSWDWDA